MTFHKEKPSCAVLRDDDGFQSSITEKHRVDNRRASTGPDKTTIGEEWGKKMDGRGGTSIRLKSATSADGLGS